MIITIPWFKKTETTAKESETINQLQILVLRSKVKKTSNINLAPANAEGRKHPTR